MTVVIGRAIIIPATKRTDLHRIKECAILLAFTNETCDNASVLRLRRIICFLEEATILTV